MTTALTNTDIDVILESIHYSIRAVRDAEGTPDVARKANLDRLERVAEKLKQLAAP